MACEHIPRSVIVNPILIPLALCFVGGMEVFVRVFDFDDHDVFGQERVEAAMENFVSEASFGGEAHDLAQSMDAGVGAAGGGDAKSFLREALPGGFDRALDGGLIGLELPAGVRGAVLGYGALEPANGHGASFEQEEQE